MTMTVVAGSNTERTLEAIAHDIESRAIDMAKNGLEIGHNFCKARDILKTRTEFRAWCLEKTRFSEPSIDRFMRVYKKFGGRSISGKTSQAVLEFLVPDHIPDSAIDELEDRANEGEVVTVKVARKIVHKHELPTPKEANKQARESKEMVLASDGYYYFGHSKEEAEIIDHRRTMVFGIRRAVETLAGIEMTPRQFLNMVPPHLDWWQEGEAKQLDKAVAWLTKLATLYRERVNGDSED